MKVITTIFLGLIVSGCVSYKTGAIFEGGDQAYYGTVAVNWGDSGSIDLQSEDGMITCRGVSQVVEKPSFFTMIGGRGHAEGKCSDGRTFKVDFIQKTETGGDGRGIDSVGNIMTVVFDRSDKSVKTALRRRQIDALIKQ